MGRRAGTGRATRVVVGAWLGAWAAFVWRAPTGLGVGALVALGLLTGLALALLRRWRRRLLR